MIGLDTNVLVRYVTQDDDAQSAAATELVESLTEAEPGYITLISIAEVWWVLRRAYSVDRTTVAEIVRRLVDSREVVVEHGDTVRRSLGRVAGGADLADALIHERVLDAGCDRTMTFDAKAAHRAGMTLIDEVPTAGQ